MEPFSKICVAELESSKDSCAGVRKGEHMAKYDQIMVCPSCGTRDLNLANYASLLVLKPHLGLFTIQCQNCDAKVSSIQPIPAELEEQVDRAAERLGAGMGRGSAI